MTIRRDIVQKEANKLKEQLELKSQLNAEDIEKEKKESLDKIMQLQSEIQSLNSQLLRTDKDIKIQKENLVISEKSAREIGQKLQLIEAEGREKRAELEADKDQLSIKLKQTEKLVLELRLEVENMHKELETKIAQLQAEKREAMNQLQVLAEQYKQKYLTAVQEQ